VPDDHARAARLREEPRTDLTVTERMFRFSEALAVRLCRELERLDPTAVQRGAPGDSACRISGGRVFASGHVAAVHTREEREEPAHVTAGLSVELWAAHAAFPGVRLLVRCVAEGPDPLQPESVAFSGVTALAGAPTDDDVEAFEGVWRALVDRHPALADGVRIGPDGRMAFGPLAEDPEGAFLFVRDLGRAFPSAYFPLVERAIRTGSAG